MEVAGTPIIPENASTKAGYRPWLQIEHQYLDALIADGKLAKTPLVVGDIGVRHGFDTSWEAFGEHCLLVGFEPEAEEHARLVQEHREVPGKPKKKYECTALWDQSGTMPLHVTQKPENSSAYPPNREFFKRLPSMDPVHVTHEIQVGAVALDDYAQEHRLHFDLLKIDVQGGELSILKGARQQLQSEIIGLILEVEFVELYKGQPLFADIDPFVRSFGFQLFDLDVRRWRRCALPGSFAGKRVGQTIYADALYLKDPIGCPGPSPMAADKLLKLAALAELFSLPDYAMELLAMGEQEQQLEPEQSRRFKELVMANSVSGIRLRDWPTLGK